jgi:hypothetical protein
MYDIADSLIQETGGIKFFMPTENTNDTWAAWEYYNGTEWKRLDVIEEPKSDEYSATSIHYTWGGPEESTGVWSIMFRQPADWAKTTVGSVSNRYMLRARLNGTTTPSITTPTGGPDNDRYVIGSVVVEAMETVKFSDKTRFVASARQQTDSTSTLDVASDVRRNWQRSVEFSSGRDRANSTVAVVPQFDEAFICYGGVTLRVTPNMESTDDPYARVETSAAIVGSKAPYDPDYIAQESSWPRSEFITFFKGRLWSASGPVIRWSAAQPAHKVWPKISQEPIMEDDNSDITGLVGYGEYVVVFKRESIYIMPSVGENEFALEQYSPVRVVSGVGCIAPESIQKVRGRLIFLSEDGLYAFDGTPNIQKLTERPYRNVDGSTEVADRMADFFQSLNPSYRRYASSAHWQERRCYLLSVPVDDSVVNDHTIVWDYANDSFWVWNGFNAQKWMVGDGPSDENELFYVDDEGFLFRFGYGHDDNYAAISAHITTQRLGYRAMDKKRFRLVDVTSTNTSKSLTVDVIPQDDEPNKDTGTLDMIDPVEKVWSDTITDSEDNWAEEQKRQSRVSFRVDSDYAQVKISHSTIHQPFELTLLEVGWFEFGER